MTCTQPGCEKPQYARRLCKYHYRQFQPGNTVLSIRETQVLQLITEGFTNREIAAELHIATETVKVQVKDILRKLDARNRAHAVAIYLKLTEREEAPV